MTKKDKVAIAVCLTAGIIVGIAAREHAYGLLTTGTLLLLYGIMGVIE